MSVWSRLIEPKQGIPAERQSFSNLDLRKLIVPIIIEQFLAMLVGLADTLMISYAGEAAVSGVSLVNQLNNVFILVFTALASGGAVVASQYMGRGDRKDGSLASGQLVMITTAISVVLTAIALIFSTQILGLLFGNVEPDVMEASLKYLRISAYSFPFLAVYNGCAGLFRSMGKTKEVMNVSIVMNVINVVGNAIGIFGLHAGVAGVAWPSFISRAFAAIVTFIWVFNKENPLYVTWKGLLSWNGGMQKRIFHIAIPNSIESGLFQISKVALSSIVAMFGTTQIAANGVAQSFWSVAALFNSAIGPAFITVIGRHMGAGDREGAKYYAQKLLRITFIGTTLWNLFFFILTFPLLGLFDISAEAKVLVIWLCLMHNIGCSVFCPIAFSLSNGLRAAGDVTYTMFAAIFSTVICRVAFSYLFGVVLGWGVIGIGLAMVTDWCIKTVLIWVRYRSGKWTEFKVI